MKKKIIINSLLASSIIGASLITGNVKAVNNVANYGKEIMAVVEKPDETKENYIMGVVLQSSNPLNGEKNILTKAKVLDILEKKYKKEIVKEICKPDGTKVEEYNEKVGTDYIVKLSTGRELRVVLYGDVNGDGEVNTNDTVAIALHDNNIKEITKETAKIAANLISDEEEQNVNIQDALRVAYYNVNGLGTKEAGDAILDIELYPEDYTDKEETVKSDEVLQKAIDDILNNEENKKLFDINLNEETNIAEFGLLDYTKKISDFTGTGIIDKLVDQLKNNNNLTKIELSVEGLEKPIVLDKEATSEKCLLAAKSLITKLLEKDDTQVSNILETTVDQLFGKELKAKFYVTDTAKLIDKKVENAEKIGETCVEYTLKFVGKIDADETMQTVIDTINENNTNKSLFKVTYDPTTNTGIFGFLDNTKKISDFYQHSTGLIKGVADQLANPNVAKIVLAIKKNGENNVYETAELTHGAGDAEDIKSVTEAAIKLIKAAFGITDEEKSRTSGVDDWKNKSVLELAGKTLNAKIYLGKDTEVYDTDVKLNGSDRYIEYNLNFLVDATNEMQKDIFDVLNAHTGNEYYRVNFDEKDDHLINFDLASSKKSETLSSIYGQGKTGLIDMAKKILSEKNKSEIKTVTANYNGKDYKIKTADTTGEIDNEALQLLDAMLGTNLSGDNTNVNNLQLSSDKLQNVKLEKLEGIELKVKLGLSEKVVTESNWKAEEEFTIKFKFVDQLSGTEAKAN